MKFLSMSLAILSLSSYSLGRDRACPPYNAKINTFVCPSSLTNRATTTIRIVKEMEIGDVQADKGSKYVGPVFLRSGEIFFDLKSTGDTNEKLQGLITRVKSGAYTGELTLTNSNGEKVPVALKECKIKL